MNETSDMVYQYRNVISLPFCTVEIQNDSYPGAGFPESELFPVAGFLIKVSMGYYL